MANADWLTVTRATGFPRWEIVAYEYIAPEDDCNNDGVNAYLKAVNPDGTMRLDDTVYWATPDDIASLKMTGGVGYCYDANGKEIPYGVAVNMTADSSFSPDRGERGPYTAYMGGNSDRISGMGLPLRRHVQYTVTWKMVLAGEEPPPPADEKQYTDWRIKRQEPTRIVLVREEIK